MPSIRDVDVVIVGGGIAGSSLAASLANAGLGVVVVERERRFRDRVRGESVHPWGVGVARELGLLDALVACGGRPLPLWREYEGRELRTSYGWQDRAPEGLSMQTSGPRGSRASPWCSSGTRRAPIPASGTASPSRFAMPASSVTS